MVDILRYTGNQFRGGGTPRRWNGTNFVPKPQLFIASGGVITDVDGYRIHTFLDDGFFQVTKGSKEIEYFIVAGGGAGSSGTAGGGAGGEILTNEDAAKVLATLQDYPVVVGEGGLAPTGTMRAGNNGNNSSFFGLTAIGGGRGAYSTSGSPAVVDANDGGNGGGACWYSSQHGLAGLAVGGGFDASDRTSVLGSGGGLGGAGAGNTNPTTNRNGGAGLQTFFRRVVEYFAGGGGGAGNGDQGNGGIGGGGNGATSTAEAGEAGKGAGGGGGWLYASGIGGKGGKGIVMIRYLLD